MNTRPQVSFRCLTITADNGRPEMDERGNYRYRYAVTVRSDSTGARRRFTFHASTADYDAGRRGLGGKDLLYAFRCFVEDAAAGEQPFSDFCSDFGYDTDSRTAERIWKGCRAAGGKLADLFHTDTDPVDLLDELSAAGIE